jgi:hypothetical protein
MPAHEKTAKSYWGWNDDGGQRAWYQELLDPTLASSTAKAPTGGASPFIDTMDRWYNPWSKQQQSTERGEGYLRVPGQVAAGTALAAGAGAGALAAAPAAGSGATALYHTAGRGLAAAGRSAAVKNTLPLLTKSPLANLTARVPAGYQASAQAVQRAAQIGGAGALGYGGYRHVQGVAGDTAADVAARFGVSDPAVLQEVRDRAGRRAFPLLYRSLAPAALGGDGTPIGKALGGSLTTAAYHNLRPATFFPKKQPLTATDALTKNPLTTAIKSFLPDRATPAEMLRNIPTGEQLRTTYNLGRAVLDEKSVSPIAQNIRHIFEPAVAHKKQQLASLVEPLRSAYPAALQLLRKKLPQQFVQNANR